MSHPAERFTEVGRERTNVGAGRALHFHKSPRRCTGFERNKLETMNGDRPCLSFDRLAPPRLFVQAFTTHTSGRDHRSNLLDFPAESPERGRNVVGRECRHVGFGHDLAGAVERVGSRSEFDPAGVALGQVRQIGQDPGEVANADNQHASRVGIERAGVPNAARAQRAPDHPNDVVARHARALVDHRDPMDVRIAAAPTRLTHDRPPRGRRDRAPLP